MNRFLAFLIVAASVFMGGSASATVCTASFSQIQALINQDIASGVPGGITAPTFNSLMQVQNNCYLNVEDYPSAALGALGIAPNTTGGFATSASRRAGLSCTICIHAPIATLSPLTVSGWAST